MADRRKGDYKSSVYLMMAAIGQNMLYMQVHDVSIPGSCRLSNSKHCLKHYGERAKYFDVTNSLKTIMYNYRNPKMHHVRWSYLYVRENAKADFARDG